MSAGIQIRLSDGATPVVRGVLGQLPIERTGPVAGRAASNLIRQHLVARNSTHPNKLGGKRTQFWSRAARSIAQEATADGARISINQVGLRLQLMGGTVRPKPGKRYLTLPAVPEAHAMLAGEFDDLEFAMVPDPKTKRMRPALVRARRSEIEIRKTRTGPKVAHVASTLGNDVVYWLIRKAVIKPHPDVLPTRDAIQAEASRAVQSFVLRQLARATTT